MPSYKQIKRIKGGRPSVLFALFSLFCHIFFALNNINCNNQHSLAHHITSKPLRPITCTSTLNSDHLSLFSRSHSLSLTHLLFHLFYKQHTASAKHQFAARQTPVSQPYHRHHTFHRINSLPHQLIREPIDPVTTAKRIQQNIFQPTNHSSLQVGTIYTQLITPLHSNFHLLLSFHRTLPLFFFVFLLHPNLRLFFPHSLTFDCLMPMTPEVFQ
ncbi:MAG: hypothetical protein J3R72DRAFT_437519 [Linnemannia gamsii]|nr:MAG: hypothetical protein J3R72DRAFT_437519 [Linnemannia gamsii]